MWFTVSAMAGVVWLLIFLQMANNHENAGHTYKNSEELNDNITTDQFAEEDNILKNNDNSVEEKFQMMQSGHIY